MPQTRGWLGHALLLTLRLLAVHALALEGDEKEDVVPGVVDAGGEEQERRCGYAEAGSAGVGGESEGSGGKAEVGDDRKGGVEEPVFEDGMVGGLAAHAADDDEGVEEADDAEERPSGAGPAEAVPGHGHGGREQEHGDEVDDGGAGEGVAGLILAGAHGHVRDEGHDEELEASEGSGRGADDFAEDLPVSERCHGVWPMLARGDVRPHAERAHPDLPSAKRRWRR